MSIFSIVIYSAFFSFVAAILLMCLHIEVSEKLGPFIERRRLSARNQYGRSRVHII